MAYKLEVELKWRLTSDEEHLYKQTATAARAVIYKRLQRTKMSGCDWAARGFDWQIKQNKSISQTKHKWCECDWMNLQSSWHQTSISQKNTSGVSVTEWTAVVMTPDINQSNKTQVVWVWLNEPAVVMTPDINQSNKTQVVWVWLNEPAVVMTPVVNQSNKTQVVWVWLNEPAVVMMPDHDKSVLADRALRDTRRTRSRQPRSDCGDWQPQRHCRRSPSPPSATTSCWVERRSDILHQHHHLVHHQQFTYIEVHNIEPSEKFCHIQKPKQAECYRP